MKPVVDRDNPNPYAPNQVEYVLTAAERSRAARYAVALERNRRERNADDAKRGRE